MVVPLGLEEINLVRKKLKWPYEAFQIPKDIMYEWKKIGTKNQKIIKNGKKIINHLKKFHQKRIF